MTRAEFARVPTGWQRVLSWAHDERKLALGATDGSLVVCDAASMEVEQVWQVAEERQGYISNDEVTEIGWLQNAKRILFQRSDRSTHMYDFERNLKWQWGSGEKTNGQLYHGIIR